MSNFTIKDKFDKKIYLIFNIVSDIFFAFNFKLKKIISDNLKYKDIHKDQRCFVIGTGPSLRMLTPDQINKLKNEIVFGVNSFHKAKILDKITPSYYSLMDNNYWGISSHTFKDVIEKYNEAPPIFITDVRAWGLVSSLSNVNYICLYLKNYPIKKIRFNISKNSSITMNTVSTCIVSAIYMGFKEVYLLGCDYNSFCSRGGSHCYDDRSENEELPKYNLAFYLKYYHITTEFHYLIAKLAKERGVKVINLTPGTLLDAYPLKNSQAVI